MVASREPLALHRFDALRRQKNPFEKYVFHYSSCALSEPGEMQSGFVMLCDGTMNIAREGLAGSFFGSWKPVSKVANGKRATSVFVHDGDPYHKWRNQGLSKNCRFVASRLRRSSSRVLPKPICGFKHSPPRSFPPPRGRCLCEGTDGQVGWALG